MLSCRSKFDNLQNEKHKILIMKKHKNQNKHDMHGNLEGRTAAKRLSDYMDGNLELIRTQAENIPDNANDSHQLAGRTISEATDPSKLSDI